MERIRLTIGALALALVALPALATNEDGLVDAALDAGEVVPVEVEMAAAPDATAEPMTGSVVRAIFTTQVVEREPQDEITSLPSGESEIVFFTELSDLTGHTLTHVWEREGTEMARVPFTVHGPRWRVHSSKKLEPSWTGEWQVSVVAEDGTVLRSERFEYVAAATAATESATEAQMEAATAELDPPESAGVAESAPPAAME